MITLQNLSLAFGERVLFKDVTLQLTPGNRYGLIGANGAGKTTFLQILAGAEPSYTGGLEIPNRLQLGLLQQDHYRFEQEPIIDVVLRGRRELWDILTRQRALLAQPRLDDADSLALAELENQLQMMHGYAAESEAAKILSGLGIAQALHLQPLSVLSGGYKLRTLLAQLLFSQPDIMLLDEPTNHLDIFSIQWLEDYLIREYTGILLVVSHDREFIESVSNYILDIDYQSVKAYKGSYRRFLEQKALEADQKERALGNQEKRREEVQRFVDRFRAKATKASAVQSRIKMLEKMDAIEIPKTSRRAPHLRFVQAQACGIRPLKVEHIDKAYDERQVLKDVSFTMERGEKIAIVGPNGIGKSTLLKILMEAIAADAGHFQWDGKARLGYFPQDHGPELDGEINLVQWLSRYDTTGSVSRVRGTLAQVLFSGDSAEHLISTLSGGESSRLLLARIMMQDHNVLVLDEPTNHLDVEAIDALAEALQAYQGSILFVSHNRWFVSSLANRIIELREDGLLDFRGTYREFLEKRQGTDHLNRSLAVPPSQRPTVPRQASLGYEERKAWQRRERQLQKQISTLEQEAESLGHQIQEALLQMADYETYSQLTPDQQLQLMRDKQTLEKRQTQALEDWHAAMEALEAMAQGVEAVQP